MVPICLIKEIWQLTIKHNWIASIIIGASLSEPHTSGTALRKCVNVRMYVLACLRPYTVNFKCAFKYFPKIERPRTLSEGHSEGICWATAKV